MLTEKRHEVVLAGVVQTLGGALIAGQFGGQLSELLGDVGLGLLGAPLFYFLIRESLREERSFADRFGYSAMLGLRTMVAAIVGLVLGFAYFAWT